MKKKIWTAGRWQPLHCEHVSLIDKLLEKDYEVLIGIRCVSKISKHNPFSPEEIKNMFYATFGNSVKTFYLTTHNPFKAKQELPKNAIFYTRDKMWATFIKTYGIPVIYEKRRGISATYIRNMIYDNDPNYKNHVPHAVANFIETKDIQNRLSSLNEETETAFDKQGLLGVICQH